MESSLFIVLLLVFIGIGVALFFWKKSIKVVISYVLILLAIPVLFLLSAFTDRIHQSITVYGIDNEITENMDNTFSHNVLNYCTSNIGGPQWTYGFYALVDKDKLFQDIEKENTDYHIDDGILYIYKKNQYYCLEYIKKESIFNQYKLYSNVILFSAYSDSQEKYVPSYFPFPKAKVVNLDKINDLRDDKSMRFHISCDMAYLMNYYKRIPKVTISGNEIKYEDVTMTVHDGIVDVRYTPKT